MRVTLLDLWGREGMLHYVSQLANHLASLPGAEITVLLPRGSDVDLFADSVALGFVDVVKDATPREFLAAPFKVLELPLFFNAIRRTRPDVIHLNNCHVWYIPTLPWLRRRYPVVATLHDVRPHPGRDDSWRKRKEIDTVARLAHHVLVHGRKLKEDLLADHPTRREDTVTMVPLGDFSFLVPRRSDAVEEHPTSLFFGRIRAYKGLEYFLQAAPLVAERLPTARFIVAGAGDLRPYGDMLAQGANFEIHNEYIPDDRVADLFGRASLVVLPYIEASQSAVVPIAYAFSKPVVTTDVGCLPDVVDEGRTGLLVPPRDPVALAQAMLRLLADDGLRMELGRNAHRKMKEELGWDEIASTTWHVYQAAVGEFRSGPATP